MDERELPLPAIPYVRSSSVPFFIQKGKLTDINASGDVGKSWLAPILWKVSIPFFASFSC